MEKKLKQYQDIKKELEQIKEKKYADSYIKDSSIRHVYTYGANSTLI